MKIHIASDLHLEFCHTNWHYDSASLPIYKSDADVLVLAGDIQVGIGHENKFFQDMLSHFKNVIYIAGNHEFYKQNYHGLSKTLPMWASALNDVSGGNFYYLDNTSVKIDDVTFIGSTLWTDFNKNDFYTKKHAQNSMNDFRLIKKNRISQKTGKIKTDRFSPTDAYALHIDSVKYISKELNDSGKKVVITHHAPSIKSISPKYRGQILNYAYFTDLEQLVSKSNLWIHGHMHESFDYTIGNARVIANPRGYVGYEINPNYQDDLVVEV